jgi:hypothetical protein
MKEHSDKSKIEKGIIEFFRTIQDNEFHADDIRRFVIKTQLLQRNPYHDTILRYMRRLAQKGAISYENIGQKSESKYQKSF